MAQIIQHRRGDLRNLINLDTVYRGEMIVATGSIKICSGSTSYSSSYSVAFIGGNDDYEPITNLLSGSGLPSLTTQTYGTYLDGILWLDTSTNSLYQLQATDVAADAALACYTGSHISIAGGGGGTIGEAEDGTYTDGLFTDFVPTTPIGVVTDRFNEILKALAPRPAPQLDNIDLDATGVTGDVSFGSSNTIAGYSNVTTVGSLPARDVNQSFTVSAAGRYGIFGSTATRTGTLNEDVAADGTYPNYVANSFGDAEKGILVLEVNGNIVHTISLSGSMGAINSTNSSGSGFSVSATASAYFDDGTAIPAFSNRQGTFTVHSSEQRNGHNYVKVTHKLPSTSIVTNFVDWVNDPYAGTSVQGLNQTGSWAFTPTDFDYISGVKYYNADADNAVVIPFTSSYTNLYEKTYPSTGGITLTNTLKVGSSQVIITGPKLTTSTQTDAGGNATYNFADLDTLFSTPHDTDTTMSFEITPSLDSNVFHHPNDWATTYGSATQAIRFQATVKPLLRSLISSTQITESDFLYNTLTSVSDVQQKEDFKSETYRTTYSVNSISSTSLWDSAQSLTTGNASHNDGLAVYNRYLVYPTKAGDNGTFTTRKGPASQPDYSGATGTRQYVRYFTVTDSGFAGIKQWSIELNGSGKVVQDGSTLFANDSEHFKVFFMRSGTGNLYNNTWIDVLSSTARVGTAITSPNAQWIPVTTSPTYTLSGVGTPSIQVPTGVLQFQDQLGNVNTVGETVGVRIVVPQGWTGYLDTMALRYGSQTTVLSF